MDERVVVLAFWDSVKWDAAKRSLPLQFSDLVSPTQCVAAWEVMVVKRNVGWLLAGPKESISTMDLDLHGKTSKNVKNKKMAIARVPEGLF